MKNVSEWPYIYAKYDKRKEKLYINTSFQQKFVRIYHSEWYHSWQNPHDKKAEKRINGHLCTQNGT